MAALTLAGRALGRHRRVLRAEHDDTPNGVVVTLSHGWTWNRATGNKVRAFPHVTAALRAVRQDVQSVAAVPSAHARKTTKPQTTRQPLSFRDAVTSLIVNFDIAWINDDEPAPTCEAVMVSIIYDRTNEEVYAEIQRQQRLTGGK